MKKKTDAPKGKKSSTVKRRAAQNVVSFRQHRSTAASHLMLTPFDPTIYQGIQLDYVRIPHTTVWGRDLYMYIDINGLAKIGRSGHTQARFREIQMYNGHRLIARQVWESFGHLEKQVHKELKLRGFHIHGEWYNIDVDTLYSVVLEVSRREEQ
jgi:hypothetical protein